ncbi:MAG: trypsin-like peptidase domain-containing protein [Pirellulales bacterium]
MTRISLRRLHRGIHGRLIFNLRIDSTARRVVIQSALIASMTACATGSYLRAQEPNTSGSQSPVVEATQSRPTDSGSKDVKPLDPKAPSEPAVESASLNDSESNSSTGSNVALDINLLAVALEQSVQHAVEKAEQSVVAIARIRRDQVDSNRIEQIIVPNPLLSTPTPAAADFVPSEFGSGVIISSDGYIVTCAHVLDDPRRYHYFVWLNKQIFRAELVAKPAEVSAADPYTDLAVLKIDASDLTPIEFGDANELRKGSFVITLGNPYAIARDGSAAAGWGIVSNLQRQAPAAESSEPKGLQTKESQHQFGTLIQTDARLNLGTSGGALVNMKGQMVGLTTSLAALSGYEQSAGFAIAVDDMFKRVVETLRSGRLPEFGFLGIQPEELSPDEKAIGMRGARVSVVVPGMPGAEAGLHPEDRIVEINHELVTDRNGLFRQLSQLPAGAEVELLVHRPRRSSADYVTLQLKAKLSKKFVSTSRPSYAIHGPKSWRGMLVEYATAVPTELARGGIVPRRANIKLVVLSVDPDSPAWKAGLRAGNALLAVQGKSIETPDAFHEAVAGAKGSVVLQVMRGGERIEPIVVTAPPETPEPIKD